MLDKPLPATWWVRWFFPLAMGFVLVACASPEERARAHYESGKILLDAKEFAKAGLEFRNALKYNEKISDAWYGLAAVEEYNQNWPAVIEDLSRVVELDSQNFDAHMKLAKLQLATINLDKALKNINKANDLQQNNTDTLALRAAILLRLGDREGARADAERALSLNPDNPDANAVLAVDQMADGNNTGALRFLDRGLAKDPNNLGLLLFKLKILEDTKDYASFEKILRQVVAAYPGVKEMRRALLSFLASQNRWPEVETEMRALVAAEPDNTTLALDLVRLVGNMRGAAGVRKELESLVAAAPDRADFKLALAQLEFSEKRTDRAISIIDEIIANSKRPEDVQRAQLLSASIKHQLGKVEEAKALIEHVLASDAKNAGALTFRANLRLEEGDPDNAIADLREALNQKPNSVPILVLMARAHERQGSNELAGDRFTEALKESNYSPNITMAYIDFLGRQGKTNQIESVLDEAVARNPGDRSLLRTLAEIKLNKQDWVGAQKISDALKKAGDKSVTSSQIMGAAMFGQKKYTESIDILKDAYSADPQSTRLIDSIVLVYLQSGDLSGAETFIQSILSANENNGAALVQLGSIRIRQNKPQEAEEAYKMAIKRQPANSNGYIALSKLYMIQKKLAEAEAVLKQGHQNAPGDLGVSLHLASLHELNNDPESAIAIYEEQLKTTPDALIIINNLASLLADFRMDAQSLQNALQLSKRLQSADVPQFKDTVGWVAYRSGDYRAAQLNLEAAVGKLPDLALAKYHLGMTYLALKRDAEAKEQFAKADALLKGSDPLKEKIRAASAKLGN